MTTSLSASKKVARQMVMRILTVAVALLFSLPARGVDADWGRFKHHYIDSSGRVIDTGQGNISHSEGQGVAMLLATYHDDHAAFDQIWKWSRQHLQVRDDHLLAWRWSPQEEVSDKNNASDGDLLVAWSLLRAFEKWRDPEYFDASKKIARDIREKLLRKTSHGLILLPGIDGFEKAEGTTINLSYWVFPALNEIDRVDPAPEWKELVTTGTTILGYAHFGRWGLPPEWLLLDDKVVPARNFPERFGYNAVRIPLYLLWSHHESKGLLKPYQDFWGYFDQSKFLPAWTNLKDDSVDSYDASTGIHGLAQWILDFSRLKITQKHIVDTHPVDEKEGYYSSVLLLLTKMAINER